MRVLFRADASLEIGNGHVMRCLTLAGALRELGVHCQFASRSHPGHLLDRVRRLGYPVLALPASGPGTGDEEDPGGPLPAMASWLGASWREDARQVQQGLGGTSFDWLVVDHYALDARWEQAMRPWARRILAVDDLADRPHDCDLLLDQNLGRSPGDYQALVGGDCQVLTGPRHALLRPEFAALRPYSLARRAAPRLRHLLLSMGGVDSEDVTGRLLDALRACALPEGCRISVAMGPNAPWRDRVREQARRMPWPTEVLVDVQEMARLMADSDLALGGTGGTAWERCCLGLPTLGMILADNQRTAARALEAAGALVLLRDREGFPLDLPETMARITPEALKAMQASCMDLTSGEGARDLALRMTSRARDEGHPIR